MRHRTLQSRYHVLGKHESQKTFGLMDINKGGRVVNKIFATILDQDHVDKFMATEAPRNQEWSFRLRRLSA